MEFKPVCPNCHRHYLEFDEYAGSWYCCICDMYFSDEDFTQKEES